MDKFRATDAKRLEERARELEEKEASEVVYERGNLRVIAGARVSSNGRRSLFIELSIHPIRNHQSPNVAFLKKQYMLVRELQSMGYSSFQDGAVIVADTRTTPKKIDSDLAILHQVIERVFE